MKNIVYYQQQRNNLKLFLDKITITDDPKKVAKSISKEHLALLKNMQRGIDKSKCNSNDSDKKCIQNFVENSGSFTLVNVTPEAVPKAEKHHIKGFIIPNTLGTKINLIFSNGTKIVELPFTIPKLPV